MKTISTIGIIGFGRFSRLMIRYLSEDLTVTVYDRQHRDEAISDLGGRAGSLAETCDRDIVIPAVPISAMKSMLERIRHLLNPDSIVADVCSVKAYPVKWMAEILPPQVAILATHPMFGPDSAADSLAGRKIVLCRQRIDAERYHCIRDYLQSRKLVIIETTPDEHDRQMAGSLALTHFIGRSLAEYGAIPLDIDTEGYKRLLYTLETVTHDTWELFVDMHKFNPYARDVRDRFRAAIERIDAQLEQATS
jgi:prephenate dehydrogenase